MFFRRRKPDPTPEPAPEQTETVGGIFGTAFVPRPRAAIMDAAYRNTFRARVEGVGMDSSSSDSGQSAKMQSQFGYGVPDAQLDWYGSQGFIGFQTCAMIAQNWLVDKACTIPARDAIRHGYEMSAPAGEKLKPEIIADIRKISKKMHLNRQMLDYIRKGRIFGIRVALFLVDGIDYEKPYNPDGVKPGSYRGIKQIDPYWITPELTSAAAGNPMSSEFYIPQYWRVGGQRIHRSHLCVFTTGDVPDILKPTYVYAGISVPQKIAERVYASERTANEAPMLAMSKRSTVLYTDLERAVANQSKFESILAGWSYFWNNYGVKVSGLGDKIEQFDLSLTDLDTIIMTQLQIVAAAANVPATKLLGTSPKGFSSTGEFEESSYHEELESIQEHDLTPLVDGHIERLMRSYIVPKYGITPIEIEIAWRPCDSPTAAELADINLKKAQTGQTLMQSGAIDGHDERARIISDNDSGYAGISTEAPNDGLVDEEEGELGEEQVD